MFFILRRVFLSSVGLLLFTSLVISQKNFKHKPKPRSQHAQAQSQPTRPIMYHTNTEIQNNNTQRDTPDFNFKGVFHHTVRHSRSKSSSSRRILIWHGILPGKQDLYKLDWMYAPMINTLIEGFKLRPPSTLNISFNSIEIVSGHSVHELKYNHWIPFTGITSIASSFLRPNDWFIFIGTRELSSVPFAQLKRAGIFTVYYQTEPLRGTLKGGGPKLSDLSDLYTYTRGNGIDQKPLPCAYLPSHTSHGYLNISSDIPNLNRSSLFKDELQVGFELRDSIDKDNGNALFRHQHVFESLHQHRMLYIGSSTNHPHRMQVLAKLEKSKIAVDIRHDLWSTADFNKVLDQYEILLDIHKDPYTPKQKQPAEGVRFSQVLSHKPCIIIAERSCEEDEKAFEGIVIFTSDFVETFRNVSSLPPSEFKSLMLSSHAKFRERFDVKRIFQEARIWESFKDNVKTEAVSS